MPSSITSLLKALAWSATFAAMLSSALRLGPGCLRQGLPELVASAKSVRGSMATALLALLLAAATRVLTAFITSICGSAPASSACCSRRCSYQSSPGSSPAVSGRASPRRWSG